MPLYEYECKDCGARFDRFNTVANRKDMRCECGGSCDIIITSVFRPMIMQPYYDTGLGCVVDSYSDRKRKMKIAGVEECGDIKHFDDVRVEKKKPNFGSFPDFGEVWRDVTQN